MRDDKKPEESTNSGDNHVKDAMQELKSFDSSTIISTRINPSAPPQMLASAVN